MCDEATILIGGVSNRQVIVKIKKAGKFGNIN
jgi:hypothetical protein